MPIFLFSFQAVSVLMSKEKCDGVSSEWSKILGTVNVISSLNIINEDVSSAFLTFHMWGPLLNLICSQPPTQNTLHTIGFYY